MNRSAAVTAALLLLGTTSASPQAAEPVVVSAVDGLSLHATLFRAAARAPLVLMFHQCNRTGPETGYESLGRRLAAAGIHAVALDSRGFGRSTGPRYPDFSRDRMDATVALWPADVDALLRDLSSRPGIDTSRLAAVGASCGVDQAIDLAARRPAVRAVVALSGSLQPAQVAAFKARRPLPTFAVVAEADGYDSPASMRALFEAAREPRSRLLTYKGRLHGTPLLADDPSLEPALVGWLGQLLAAPGAGVPGDTAVYDGETVEIENGQVRIAVVARGLQIPSALAFLPDGRGLLAERMAGRLSLFAPGSGSLTPVAGVPAMHRGRNQEEEGGLFDVAVHPDFARNGWIYLCYSEGTPEGNTTVVDRARLEGSRLTGRQRLFTARPHVKSSIHFGGRVVLTGGYLFVTVGERDERDRAQDLGQHHGKVIRLHDDGRVPKDNPFVGRAGALPEIWSYGHRNPQGLALNPADGLLWEHEHGPRGGDEVNVVRRGGNYGWPLITYGREYTGEQVGAGLGEKAGLEQPVYYWLPSIAPGGMDFYTGSLFPQWRGSLLVGAMARGHLNRLVVRDGRVLHEERLPAGKRWRVRLVRQGPEGEVYLGTDAGYLLKLTPAGQRDGGAAGR